MRTVRLLAVLAALLGATASHVAGQEAPADVRVQVARLRAQQARVFQTTSLARFDEQAVRDEQVGEAVPAVERLSDIVQRLGGADPKTAPLVFQHARSTNRGEVVIARGTAEQLDVAGRVFAQLTQPDLAKARLQCSLVTMPVAVARDHGLKPGEVVPTDEPTAARIMRDAVKADGTLRNLPEAVVGPLAPFMRDAGERAGEKAAGGRRPPLQLRGEMVPIGDGEVAVGVHVVRGQLPRDPTQVPDSALMQPVFRLAAGRSALFMVVERDVATVLLVRCVDVTNEAPREAVIR